MLPLSSLNSAALLRLVALKLLVLMRSPMGLCSEALMLLMARLTQSMQSMQSMQSIWAVWAVQRGLSASSASKLRDRS